tara:strand:- start:94 stop:447 length:354 start_codon:yes stop_codon:yes gene_type:complete
MRSSCNVGKQPTSFFADVLPWMSQEGFNVIENAGINDALGLSIATGDKIAKSAQCGGDKIGLFRGEQMHKATSNTSIHYGSDTTVVSVTEVRKGPARVDKDIIGSTIIMQEGCKVRQ